MVNVRTLLCSRVAGPLLGAALMALQGCAAPPARDSAADTTASLPSECPALLASGRPVFPLEEWEREYFGISRYAEFPPGDRLLLQRANVENTRCRGGRGDDPETLRACNRRHCVMLELEARGWRWGGGSSGADDHWVRWSDFPHYPPMGRDLPFSEEEIRRRASDWGTERKPIAKPPQTEAAERGAHAAPDEDRIR